MARASRKTINLTMPKNCGDTALLNAYLAYYYEREDWVTNQELIEYGRSNDTEKRDDGSDYTKDIQVLSYLGFLDYEEPLSDSCKKKISELGKAMHISLVNNDKVNMLTTLLNAIEVGHFGRNNNACKSNSDVEPLGVLVKSLMILGYVTNSEYVYILYNLHEKKKSELDLLLDVNMYRHKNKPIIFSKQINQKQYQNKEVIVIPAEYDKMSDLKPIQALTEWEFLSKNDDGMFFLNELLVSNYEERLLDLKTFNNEQSIVDAEDNFIEDDKEKRLMPDFGNRPLISALRTKPFLLLAGISGTGKSRIVRELAFKSCPSYLRDKDETTPGNYCMIEVKPNWHDSSELLGYYSNISKKFMFTKFVKFLVRAKMHPNVPFFVCLDEMNLAPVEQYFAEFLSVLETRKHSADEETTVVTGNLLKPEDFVFTEEVGGFTRTRYLTDAQWVYHFFDKNNLSDEEIAKIDEHTDQTLSYKGLSLPDNVFIIGTVNMDDTTHQFSRKVIDRAMTIEMNGGNLEDMFGGSNDLKYPTEADEDILSMDDLRAEYVNADEVLEKCERVKDNEAAKRFITGKDNDGNLVPEDENTLPKKLNAINKALEGTPYQVSYRVFNELVIYLAVLLDKKENADKELEELADQALDQITLMKILPRVEGDADMFMLHTETIDDKDVKNKLEWLKSIMPEGASSKKLTEMIDRLDKTEFTRFWP